MLQTLLSLALAFSVVTVGKLPEWFPVDGIVIVRPQDVVTEHYGRGKFRVAKSGSQGAYDWKYVLGRHWYARLWPPQKDPKEWKNWDPLKAWAEMEPRLKKLGFAEPYRDVRLDNGSVNATFEKGPANEPTYLRIELRKDPHDGEMELVEVAPNPLVLDAPPPSATPEKFGDNDPFPYLPPVPGIRFLHGGHETGTFAPFVTEREQRPVATGYMEREYKSDGTISTFEFVDAYEKLLTKNGWTITHAKPDQGNIYAHFTKNGRDIWIFARTGEHFLYRVADIGNDLATLKTNCKVALYGINFDFDKATIRPDSEPTLNQIVRLMKDEPKLALEIGGHTDNVGKPDYNLTLSDKRAAAVKEWLIAHGVPASRLSSRGYGDKVPLVPNNSDDNRAKNRRVELKKPNC